MSIAWTTVLIIVFLFPGILFHVGFYARDRIPREIVRVGVISEIAVAIFVSILIHLVAWSAIDRLVAWSANDGFGVSVEGFLMPLADITNMPSERSFDVIAERLFPLSIYVLLSAGAGYLIGVALGRSGLFATHKWARDLRSKDVLVTAYVMTKTIVDDKVLMYRGGLTEFYLKSDGSISYVVLNEVRKFHMSAAGDRWTMAEPQSLFGASNDLSGKLWSFLSIDGANVANILFERSPKLAVTDAGTQALNKALEELAEALRKTSPQTGE